MIDTDATAADNKDERTPKQKLVDNEQVKISATGLNNAAVAAFVTGVIAPVATDLYGITVPKAPYWWVFGLCWIVAAGILHLAARKALKGLTP